MRVISNKTLKNFSAIHRDADGALQAWRKSIESRAFLNFADLKLTFHATDKVGDYYIFNVGGNKYRIVTSIHFNSQQLFIRHVFTHKDYNKWKP
ncbi:type II toxin-antitoxin system HigB family toxin [Massilia sp. P8910]|uniref:type II toxin-antitoxin system HigB family toxin n=1 Tax=Massilia antarctica TaxID=2765360 RepID=UPI001E496AEA|nr:type II toxin-antitoxin system HigB family toxin [Massilia antarctica]MCE3607590.1 type II toxin-antitoxin system HigB family toxin [Massilia antarctica]